MAMKKETDGKAPQSCQGMPGQGKYDPEEKMDAAAVLSKKCILSIRDGEDLQTAYALLKDSCRTLEQLIWDGTHTDRFDDSRRKSEYRGKRYREWICSQCAAMLALQYKTLGECAGTLQQKDVIPQYLSRMLYYAEKTDEVYKASETQQILLSALAAAGDWCLHQLDPPDPKRAFHYAFRLVQTVEQPQDQRGTPDDVVQPLLADAAKTIYESVTMAPALGRGLNKSFDAALALGKKTGYKRHRLMIYAPLQGDLLEWMLDHGENWHGLWGGEDVPFSHAFTVVAKGAIEANIFAENAHFRQQTLRILEKLQDAWSHDALANVILQYCDAHQDDEEDGVPEDVVRLLEDVRAVIGKDGKYNCDPATWLYSQKMRSDLAFQQDQDAEVDAIAVETLQDVAELRQGCSIGKWNPKEIQNRALALYLLHMLNLVESNAYLKRAIVSDHLDRGKEVMEYLDLAEAVLDRGEETDRLYPQLRDNVHQMRLKTMEKYPVEELDGKRQ